MINFFFFFQAEDGIRDTSVTGVQTCALPIYVAVYDPQSAFDVALFQANGSRARRLAVVMNRHETRSEERRVGKGWRTLLSSKGSPRYARCCGGDLVHRRVRCHRSRRILTVRG